MGWQILLNFCLVGWLVGAEKVWWVKVHFPKGNWIQNAWAMLCVLLFSCHCGVAVVRAQWLGDFLEERLLVDKSSIVWVLEFLC